MIESTEASGVPAGIRSSEADDAELIRRSVGVPEVFAELFDRHGRALHRYIARRLGADAADDLVSESFLIAFSRRADYDGAYRDARPWLYGIATNLIGRRRRDEIRLLRALSRVGVGADTELSEDLVIDRVAAQAVRGRLLNALAGLPAPHRDTLLLVASGLSLDEVAAALNVPAGTIASRLARSRRKLRSALGGVNPVQARED